VTVVLTSFFCRQPSGNTRYVFKTSGQEVFVKIGWQKLSFDQSPVVDFLDLDYYYKAIDSYSSWSFYRHAQQVASVFKNIPAYLEVVAPGDGYGVVQKTIPNPVVAGDLVVSSEKVYRESFQETMARASSSSILVLSYVVSLMSVEDLVKVRAWRGPIIVIDSHHVGSIPGLSPLGHGISVLNFPHDWITDDLPIVEGFKEPPLLFTENLLRLPVIFGGLHNDASRYWKQMRPFAPVADSPNDGTIVSSTLHEYFCYVKFFKSPVWLSSIGGFPSDPLDVPDGIMLSLAIRTLYKLDEHDFRVAWFKHKVHSTVFNGSFVFCSHYERKLTFVSRDSRISISFKEIRPKNGVAKLRQVTSSHIVWDCFGDTAVWSYSPFSCAIAYIYLNIFGGSHGWKAKLLGTNLRNYDPKDFPGSRPYVIKALDAVPNSRLVPLGWHLNDLQWENWNMMDSFITSWKRERGGWKIVFGLKVYERDDSVVQVGVNSSELVVTECNEEDEFYSGE